LKGYPSSCLEEQKNNDKNKKKNAAWLSPDTEVFWDVTLRVSVSRRFEIPCWTQLQQSMNSGIIQSEPLDPRELFHYVKGKGKVIPLQA
jgi:hypothetical protein